MTGDRIAPWVLLTIAALLLLRQMPRAEAEQGRMLPRVVSGELPVVSEGVAQAVIVAPADAGFAAVAHELAAQISELAGVEVPVVGDHAVVGPDRRTVLDAYRAKPLILIGNALNNLALVPLYCRWLDAADGHYPGGDGYELRTISNPYGTGCQELVLGATTAAGARKALDALRTHLLQARQARGLVLPRLLEVQVGAELQPLFRSAVAEVKANPERKIGVAVTQPQMALFCDDALCYQWTGEPAFGQRALGVLREMNRRFDGIYHDDVRTCDDYALERAARGAVILAQAGLLSPQELLETDSNLFHDAPYAAHGPGPVGERHHSSGTLAFFVAVDALLTYGNPDVAARATLAGWRDGMRAYFRGACQTYRGDVDNVTDYGSMENIFRYAIHDGYWEYFNSGWADRTVGQMLMNIDNSGAYGGVGSYGEGLPGSLSLSAAVSLPLRITAFVERRGDLRWVYENVPNMDGLFLGFVALDIHRFDMGGAVPAEAPHGQGTGLTVLPLDEYHHRLGQTSEIAEGVGPIALPRERCLDKLLFRGGFGQLDPYLLINGFQTTPFGVHDGGAIVRYRDQGEVWLFQNTQEVGHGTKNAVWVSDGRNTDLLEGCAELRRAADLGPVCISTTGLPRYHGTDWERTVFWRRGGAFVVLDRVRVEQPGAHMAACTWRSPRLASLLADGSWQSHTEAATFTLRPAGATDLDLAAPLPRGRDGRQELAAAPGAGSEAFRGDDRFSAEVPWVLQQWQRPPAGHADHPGPVIAYQNVFSVSTPAAPQAYALARLSDCTVLLRGWRGDGAARVHELGLLGTGRHQQDATLGVDAGAYWLGSHDLSVAELRRLDLGPDAWLQAESPVDMHLGQEAGDLSGTVTAAQATELNVSLPGLTEVSLDGGAATPAADRVARIAVAAGKHTLTCHADGAQVFGPLTGHLEALWRVAAGAKSPGERPESRPSAAVPPLPIRTLWTYDGLRNRTQTVRDLTVTSRVDGGKWQRGPQAIVGDTFNTACASWPGAQVEISIASPREVHLRGLRITDSLGNVDVAQTKPNPPQVVEVAFSDDGFSHDVRLSPMPMAQTYRYRRPFYGGYFDSEVVYALEGLDIRARAVRFTLKRPPGCSATQLGHVELLADGIADPVPLRARGVRWGQADACSIWNPDSGSIRLLGERGEVLWQRDMQAAITGVDARDARGDGTSEMAVTSADWFARVFDRQSREVLAKDCRELYAATQGKYYYIGGCPHGVCITTPPGGAARELTVGHYYFLSTLKADGSLASTQEGTACFWQDFLRTGVDLNGDGVPELVCYSEAPWPGQVPVLVLDGATHKMLSYFYAGNGGAKLLQMVKANGEDLVAVGSRRGGGFYSLARRQYAWYRGGDAQKSAFCVADVDGDAEPEMLIGQSDGNVAVVSARGETVRQWDMGEAVLAIGVLPSGHGPLILVSTRHGTRGFDGQCRPVGSSPLVAQRLEPASVGGKPALLALHEDGRAEMLQAR